ncbi:MAG: PD-(D/E)XK nuclease family protein [Oscillospiraceae bacterium]|nr:PD-(D/E)XK nuclease family protein [Oscillospiraceae bacterium]
MRKIASEPEFLRTFFLRGEQLAAKGYDRAAFSVETVAHSVMTEDGESDIEAILSINGKKIALLIEDKIDAKAMPEQAARYQTRGQKAVARGQYDEFFVFIIAPKDYLNSNAEAKKYPHRIPYEEILSGVEDMYERAVIRRALSDANNVRLPRSSVVTAFWDRLYDFIDDRYPNVFRVHGHRGLERSGQAGQWISMTCAKPYGIQIKSSKGYVDLEISGYADRFAQFSGDNKDLIDVNRLYIRTAMKSLAIRKYVETIDFTQPFETQIPALTMALDAAKELQDLIPKLKLN